LKDLVLMVQFLTRIPLRISVDTDENSFARGVLFFPIIGLIIGMFNYALYEGALILLPKGGVLLASIFAVLGNLMITGGLHFDGLADTCDGIFSGRKRERILEIMKDSHIGTFGTLAIVVDLLLRTGVIQGLSGQYIALGIILSPVIAKTSVVQLMAFSTYARKEGMGGFFLGKMVRWRIVASSILGITLMNFIGFLSLGAIGTMKGLLLNLVVIVYMSFVMFGYRSYIYKYLQGMTGDTVGGANEVFEWAFLILVLLISGGLV